jgi:hypothetical protein
MKEIQVCSNKGSGHGLLQRQDNHKNATIGAISFKNLENYSARKAKIYMKAF